MARDHDIPPGFGKHVKHAPDIYYFFCGFGLFFLVVVLLVSVPHISQLNATGNKVRKQYGRVFLPRAFTYMVFINAMVPMFALFNFMILLSPASAYAMEFCIGCYEAFAFVVFKRLLTLYLGGPENGLRLMRTYPPKKLWASFPMCLCWICCYPCIPHTHLSPTTFRLVYSGVNQFVFLMPLLSFIQVVRGYSGSGRDHSVVQRSINGIRLVSVMVCVYALFVYMKAASECLENYAVRRKFWVMKATIVVVAFIPNAVLFLHVPKNHHNDDYSSDVMASAYAAITALALFVPLSLAIKRNFNEDYCDLTRPVFMTEDFSSKNGTIATYKDSLVSTDLSEYGTDYTTASEYAGTTTDGASTLINDGLSEVHIKRYVQDL